VEYPPIMEYQKFFGKVIAIERKDILLSIELQRRLRAIGKPKPFADLLIASICINRNEELITKDKRFLGYYRGFRVKGRIPTRVPNLSFSTPKQQKKWHELNNLWS